MIGVYIRGMKKPEKCSDCIMFVDGWCRAIPTQYTEGKPIVTELDDLCPLEERKGHWVYENDPEAPILFRTRWRCTACGLIQTYGKTLYCPNCGADMGKEEK